MSDDLAGNWFRDGYVVARGLLDAQRVDRLLGVCAEVLRQWRIRDPQSGAEGGREDAHSMRHLNHPAYFASDRSGLLEILDSIAEPRVLDVCAAFLGEQPLFRCTSLFMNPQQTSQDGSWHRDSQFITPDVGEEKKSVAASQNSGEAIQLQLALVASGDVEFVPGSHRRWDTDEEFQIRRADGGSNSRSHAMPEALRSELEPGDAMAVNPYGLHRGRYHADKLRSTYMLTYARSSLPGYDYFSHHPWFAEAGYLDGVEPATREFFASFVDAYAAQWAETGTTFKTG